MQQLLQKFLDVNREGQKTYHGCSKYGLSNTRWNIYAFDSSKTHKTGVKEDLESLVAPLGLVVVLY